MIVTRLWHDLDSWLAGKPDSTLTVLLLITSLVGIAIALWGPRPLKPVVLLYWWLP